VGVCYEPLRAGRYAAILNTLGGRRYVRAFEPGCSVGVLTERLARICDTVEALDISETAVSRARERCRMLRNVSIAHGTLPSNIPDGRFDLIVLSEIGYYFDANRLSAIATQLVQRLVNEGVFLGVHWLGRSPDHRLRGEEVHRILNAVLSLRRTFTHRYRGFLMERWICV
jgi:SAM-dependent methyltransferase